MQIEGTIFLADTYDSPEPGPLPLGDLLLLKSRWYFYYKMFQVRNRYQPMAAKGTFDRAAWVKSSIETAKVVELIGGRIHVRGLDNLRCADTALVIVSNHMSTLETMIFPGIIASQRPATFVIKKAIMKNPFFGDIMGATHPIVVSRDNPRADLKKVLDEGSDHIARGVSVILFPQGTRSSSFNPDDFNSLGEKLAKKAGVRVVPVAIKTDLWGNSSLRFMKLLGPVDRKKEVFVEFGAPIEITGNGQQEHASIVSFIGERLRRWSIGG